MNRFTRDALFIYLAFLMCYWLAIFFMGDRWWPTTMAMFAPQWVVALPLAILAPVTLFSRPALAPAYTIHAAFIVFFIMDLRIQLPTNPDSEHDTQLSVLTYNVGGGKIGASNLANLIDETNADVVMLQECDPKVADEVFRLLDWECRREGLLAIGSRYPLSQSEVLARHEPQQHLAVAMFCTAELPNGEEQLLVNVHLPTPRPGILAVWESGLDGTAELSEIIDYRKKASANLAQTLDDLEGSKVIAGDFNMPVTSSIYRHSWSCFENAFVSQGSGFGYTKKTRWHGIRIDHILHDNRWTAVTSSTQPSLGGDHLPVLAELVKSP